MAQRRLFGFTFGKPDEQPREVVRSFVPDQEGSTVTLNDTGMAVGGAYQVGFDQRVFETIHSENELIRKYREISMFTEVDFAIEEITSEAIVFEDQEQAVSLDLEQIDVPDAIKKKMYEAFDVVLKELDFRKRGHDIFRRWYTDGRIFYHIMIDEKNPKNGIQGLRYIDPRKIKKVRRPKNVKPSAANSLSPNSNMGNKKPDDLVNVLMDDSKFEEFYLYSNFGVDNAKTGGTNTVSISATDEQKAITIAKDSIAYSDCGIYDKNGRIILSHLHKAVRIANNLKNMEDAMLIYRLARAPERKAFFVDTGNLPKAQAESYMQAMIAKHRTKQIYDPTTGEIKDDVRFLALTEDYWLPRRDGRNSTDIQVLQGGQNLGETNDVLYFQEKLFRSLNVPLGRFLPEKSQGPIAVFASSQEITREELRFGRFIGLLRSRFNMLFEDLLRAQLVLTGVMSQEDFDQIRHHLSFVYLQDNHFTEIVENSVLTNRMSILQTTDPYMGIYFSKAWVRKNILRLTEEDIKQIQKEIEDEKQNEPQLPNGADMNMPGMPGQDQDGPGGAPQDGGFPPGKDGAGPDKSEQ